MIDDQSALANFGGTARLFPLPNIVLFPQVMQPLHIFEPRYRQMTAEALAGDRLIALALLLPGWEADYADRPAVYPVACLGCIVAEQRLDDGRFNILLRGLWRIRLVEELDSGKLYRCARAELLHDTPVVSSNVNRRLRRLLRRHVPPWFAGQGTALEQVHKLLRSDQPLGCLSDVLAFALPLAVEEKQKLLETLDVAERTNRLIAHLKNPPPAGTPAKRPFPPEFSAN